ncbi:MAG: hypothetical protein SPC78_00240 [Candidatus Faecousia sp.]|nr:hypothetical protein [Clostridiales bacterium]MDY4598054.1 hypothetical protein [Candidatus Faecousia sp.]
MDWVTNKRTVLDFLKKYRLAIIVLLAGILLLVFPNGEKQEEKSMPVSTEESLQESLQDSLEEILSQISGAGKVSVLLTQAAGKETIYQIDENTSAENGGSSSHRQTVLISGTGREENGLIRQVKEPTYLGAVIVCQGADNAAVRLAVVEAVRSATGLTTDRISVLKMK